MAKLQNYNGRYCEWDFEYAFISFLENEGWHYLPGNSITRNSKRDVLYVDDMEQFLGKKVMLTTYVKVKEDWRNSGSLLKEFGYQE